jgi:hypothetical protein
LEKEEGEGDSKQLRELPLPPTGMEKNAFFECASLPLTPALSPARNRFLVGERGGKRGIRSNLENSLSRQREWRRTLFLSAGEGWGEGN